jgi:hypothetical protein
LLLGLRRGAALLRRAALLLNLACHHLLHFRLRSWPHW